MLSYDENTINQYIQNNHYNFEKFIDMYSTDILKTIAYVLDKPEEREYIEECYDDVIMKIFDSGDKFKYDSSFRFFVMKIAKNKALDYKRKLKKFNSETEISERLASEFDIENVLMEKELKIRINNIVSMMKENEKTLFIDKYILGYENLEICKKYYINMDVLYKRLSRVRSKFKKLWIESGNGEEDVYDSGK